MCVYVHKLTYTLLAPFSIFLDTFALSICIINKTVTSEEVEAMPVSGFLGFYEDYAVNSRGLLHLRNLFYGSSA